jgi:2-oxoglutarate ferredoxin oxidoreductase subunit alpha
LPADFVCWQEEHTEDAELVVVAFGTAARVAQTAVKRLRRDGVPLGLFRPITLWPFPEAELGRLTSRAKAFLTIEMNAGQMVTDVIRSVGRDTQVEFLGWPGGKIPHSEEIEEKALSMWRQIGVVRQHL